MVENISINMLVPGEAHTEMNQGSTDSPYSLACMALTLLSHPSGGPNGCFFHRDGRHLAFAYTPPFCGDLYEGDRGVWMMVRPLVVFWRLCDAT